LLWSLDWGEAEAKIIEATRGRKVPPLPFLETKAEVDEHLAFEWVAFAELNSDRPVGMTAGQIPWSSIDRYAERHGLGLDEFDRFYRLISAMDAAFLNWHRERDKHARAE
jgi:hypothetical protein